MMAKAMVGMALCLGMAVEAGAYEYRYPDARLATTRKEALTLDGYRFAGTNLNCTLPEGIPVLVIPVHDPGEFAFLAVKTVQGLGILANERVIRSQNSAFAVYSFFRECGLHAVADVQTRSAQDERSHDAKLIRMAECLAVLPTREALRMRVFPYSQIARDLKSHHALYRGASSAELQRCGQAAYVSQQASQFPPPRRSP